MSISCAAGFRTRLCRWAALIVVLVSITLMHPMSLPSTQPVLTSSTSVHHAPSAAQPHAAVTASNPHEQQPTGRYPMSGCPNCATAAGSSSHHSPTGPMGCIAAAGCVMAIVLLAIAVVVRGRTGGRWWYCRARSSGVARIGHRRRRSTPSLRELSILRT